MAERAAVTAAYKVGSRLARLLPSPAAAMAGRAIGMGLAGTDAERRRTVERNLQRIHGEKYDPFYFSGLRLDCGTRCSNHSWNP